MFGEVLRAGSVGLKQDTYSSHFHLALYADEIGTEIQLKRAGTHNQPMRAVGPMLVLRVPGLKDRTPHVMVGDSVIAADEEELEKAWEGCIHDIHGDELFLRFNPKLHAQHLPSSRYAVRFCVNRMPYRLAHQGVELAKRLAATVLFPEPQHLTRRKAPLVSPNVTFSNTTLNAEQRLAVRNMITAQVRPVPFILYGPPGTG